MINEERIAIEVNELPAKAKKEGKAVEKMDDPGTVARNSIDEKESDNRIAEKVKFTFVAPMANYGYWEQEALAVSEACKERGIDINFQPGRLLPDYSRI